MDWISITQSYWWAFLTLGTIISAIIALAVKIDRAKEQIYKVAEHDKTIKTMKGEISDIREDIADIKNGFAKQRENQAATNELLLSLLVALRDKGCDISDAQKKFNEHIANH
jgi:predicted  nucleic acid-binding Zn-ribbon protein